MNALLLESPFPSFDLISADQVVPAIEAILKNCRAQHGHEGSNAGGFDWDSGNQLLLMLRLRRFSTFCIDFGLVRLPLRYYVHRLLAT